MHAICLTILLIFLSEPYVFAANFKHYVLEVLGSGAQIKLDDGFVWEVPQDSFLGHIINDYQAETKTWIPGDEVILDFLDIGDRVPRIVFKLKNLRTLKSVSVKYRKQNEDWISPYIIALESKGYFITLSDGTRWEVGGFWNTRSSANWAKGDRIAVYQSNSSTDFVLLNPDYGGKRDWFGLPTPYHYSCTYAIPSKES